MTHFCVKSRRVYGSGQAGFVNYRCDTRTNHEVFLGITPWIKLHQPIHIEQVGFGRLLLRDAGHASELR